MFSHQKIWEDFRIFAHDIEEQRNHMVKFELNWIVNAWSRKQLKKIETQNVLAFIHFQNEIGKMIYML